MKPAIKAFFIICLIVHTCQLPTNISLLPFVPHLSNKDAALSICFEGTISVYSTDINKQLQHPFRKSLSKTNRRVQGQLISTRLSVVVLCLRRRCHPASSACSVLCSALLGAAVPDRRKHVLTTRPGSPPADCENTSASTHSGSYMTADAETLLLYWKSAASQRYNVLLRRSAKSL